MLRDYKSGKGELFLSIIVSLLVVLISLVLNNIDVLEESFFIIMLFGMALWPIIEVVNYKCKLYLLEGIKRSVLELKLSLVSWIVLSIFLLISDLLINKEVSLSLYPVLVLMLWPIYNIFLYLTKAYSLKK